MQIQAEELKSFIADSGLVSKADLEQAHLEAEKKNLSLGEVLVISGKMSEDNLRRTESYLLGIPFVNLKGLKIDKEILSIIPEPIARKHNIIAYKKGESDLEVAMLDPQDLESIEFIKKKAGLRIAPRLTDRDSIKAALFQYQKSLKAEFGDIIQEQARILLIPEEVDMQDAGEKDLKKIAEDLPVVRIVDSLLSHAVTQQASDIHIEPLEKELLIRYRIDGILHDAMILPKNVTSAIIARIKVLSNLRLDEKRLPQDGRFKIETDGVTADKVSFRVSILPTFYGEKIAMRLLPENTKGFHLESLGFHGEALERIHQARRATTGILLTTGPTGSGKTTTLYTLIDILNTPQVNISTIEDPIEYQMARVNQTQVRPDIGLSFANGLRTLLRQDPNIIMVGEIRDGETAGLAINAALTGHLVLSTLHTNSAAGAIPRLIDMGGEPFLLVSTINAIIAQRLLRRLCMGGEKYFLSKTELDSLEKQANLERVLTALKKEQKVKSDDTWDKIAFWRPSSSSDCPEGYSGRITVSEVLKMSAPIRDLVMKGATSQVIQDQAVKEGMLTIFEDGIFQAASGVTSLEEVYRVVGEE